MCIYLNRGIRRQLTLISFHKTMIVFETDDSKATSEWHLTSRLTAQCCILITSTKFLNDYKNHWNWKCSIFSEMIKLPPICNTSMMWHLRENVLIDAQLSIPLPTFDKPYHITELVNKWLQIESFNGKNKEC